MSPAIVRGFFVAVMNVPYLLSAYESPAIRYSIVMQVIDPELFLAHAAIQ